MVSCNVVHVSCDVWYKLRLSRSWGLEETLRWKQSVMASVALNPWVNDDAVEVCEALNGKDA